MRSTRTIQPASSQLEVVGDRAKIPIRYGFKDGLRFPRSSGSLLRTSSTKRASALCDDGAVSDDGLALATPTLGTGLGACGLESRLVRAHRDAVLLLCSASGAGRSRRVGISSASPAVEPSFSIFDRSRPDGTALAITGATGLSTVRSGGRPENYPRVWMAASILGLGEDDTDPIGYVIAVAFFLAAIIVLPRRAPLGDALIYGVALCSPAVMLGVERGNVDIALFSLIAAAGLVMRRTRYGPPVASALILVAAVLKLFPIAAVGMLARLPRRAAVMCVASVVGPLRGLRGGDIPRHPDHRAGTASGRRVRVRSPHLRQLARAPRRAGTDVGCYLVILAIAAAMAFRRWLHNHLGTGPRESSTSSGLVQESTSQPSCSGAAPTTGSSFSS